ncbi:hypothetical protein [Methylomonas methanica]|uniref:Peptidase M41 domain-containing protein n=1 Tax=Methylomonas methanica (strain DSM 25384 / MC09) TaxID=857087 RepID=F9ZYQ0_METMM|nr:hypothetical protein [Methylomonas methanica]AEF98596.1 hypothetical protein Metme_0146 [Methylomonas methanica MC09]
MERNYQVAASVFVHPDELNCRTAFHEAGHAAAIHIRNRQKQLPPVFFEIQVKRPQSSEFEFFAKVVDGNLIQNLPIAVVESFSVLTNTGLHSCQAAYEADVVNLLVGPLAEAKYVAGCDGEIFKLELMNLEALRHYGGHSDLERAQYYLEYFITSKPHREKKLAELLVQAYRFIDNSQHWACIEGLARFILDSRQEVISCDEAIAVFDACMYAPQHERWINMPEFSGR